MCIFHSFKKNSFLSQCFFKTAMGILQSPQYVGQSRYLLLNHWRKSNQIWCISCSHGWGMQQQKKCPANGALVRGQKVCLFVHPSCYFNENHKMKSNQILCVSFSHEWGVQQQKFFGPAHLGPGEGQKGQISLNFNYIVNFKHF